MGGLASKLARNLITTVVLFIVSKLIDCNLRCE